MSALAAYVEQSDALLGVLTVHETIRFAARLRCALASGLVNVSPTDIEMIVWTQRHLRTRSAHA